MDDMNNANQGSQTLSKLSNKLHDQLDKFCDVEALLNCAAVKLWESDGAAERGDGTAEDARRVICIALGIVRNIRENIDNASLDASLIGDEFAAELAVP